MRSSWPLLVLVLRKERTLAVLNQSEWDLLIRQAKRSQLAAKIYYWAESENLLTSLPNGVLRHLQSAKVQADKQYRDFLWEINCLKKAFSQSVSGAILLKGAAYAAGEFPPYKGRLFSDIDILVPFEFIPAIEQQLLIHGWVSAKQDAYDQKYYRQWMHEIPPLTHIKRGSVIDLHHNILPRTATACPDADLLIKSAVPLTGVHSNLQVLSPLDRVIHSATHLFYEGELEHGLRDLVDLDALISAFNEQERLQLVDRAFMLGLQKPVYYAMRYLQLILNVQGLTEALGKMTNAGPVIRGVWLMDALFLRALMPDHLSCEDKWTPMARWMLYIRSHYLRMPLHLLFPHLLRKVWMRLLGKDRQ